MEGVTLNDTVDVLDSPRMEYWSDIKRPPKNLLKFLQNTFINQAGLETSGDVISLRCPPLPFFIVL